MQVAVGKKFRLDSWARVTCGWRGAEERLSDSRGLFVRGGSWEVIAHGACRGQWVARAERWHDLFIMAAPRQLRLGPGAGWRPELARLAERLTAADWYRGDHEVKVASECRPRLADGSEFDPRRVVAVRPMSGPCEYRVRDSLGDVWATRVEPREWLSVPPYLVDGRVVQSVWYLSEPVFETDAVRADADVVRRVLGR